jgi:hypothetical protein
MLYSVVALHFSIMLAIAEYRRVFVTDELFSAFGIPNKMLNIISLPELKTYAADAKPFSFL